MCAVSQSLITDKIQSLTQAVSATLHRLTGGHCVVGRKWQHTVVTNDIWKTKLENNVCNIWHVCNLWFARMCEPVVALQFYTITLLSYYIMPGKASELTKTRILKHFMAVFFLFWICNNIETCNMVNLSIVLLWIYLLINNCFFFYCKST